MYITTNEATGDGEYITPDAPCAATETSPEPDGMYITPNEATAGDGEYINPAVSPYLSVVPDSSGRDYVELRSSTDCYYLQPQQPQQPQQPREDNSAYCLHRDNRTYANQDG